MVYDSQSCTGDVFAILYDNVIHSMMYAMLGQGLKVAWY